MVEVKCYVGNCKNRDTKNVCLQNHSINVSGNCDSYGFERVEGKKSLLEKEREKAFLEKHKLSHKRIKTEEKENDIMQSSTY